MGIIDKIKSKRRDLEKMQINRDKVNLKNLEKQKKREGTRLEIRKKRRELREIKHKERDGGGRITGILQDLGKSVSNADFSIMEESPNRKSPDLFGDSSKTTRNKKSKQEEDLW